MGRVYKNVPLETLPQGHYGFILADPPWKFQTWSHRGENRGAAQHYRTMPTADISALPVAPLAAKDCVLYIWGTWTHLPDCLAIIAAWGFTYKTAGFVWLKLNKGAPQLYVDLNDTFLGLGYGPRGNTEYCLRATRGKPKTNNKGVSQLLFGEDPAPQIIASHIREHSRKPEEQYDGIEALYDGPHLELFARTARPGWDAWGNQVGKFGSTTEVKHAGNA